MSRFPKSRHTHMTLVNDCKQTEANDIYDKLPAKDLLCSPYCHLANPGKQCYPYYLVRDKVKYNVGKGPLIENNLASTGQLSSSSIKQIGKKNTQNKKLQSVLAARNAQLIDFEVLFLSSEPLADSLMRRSREQYVNHPILNQENSGSQWSYGKFMILGSQWSPVARLHWITHPPAAG